MWGGFWGVLGGFSVKFMKVCENNALPVPLLRQVREEVQEERVPHGGPARSPADFSGVIF